MNLVKLLLILGISALISGCSTEAGMSDECQFNCQYPDYKRSERESAIDINNHRTNEKRLKNKKPPAHEDRGKPPVYKGIGTND